MLINQVSVESTMTPCQCTLSKAPLIAVDVGCIQFLCGYSPNLMVFIAFLCFLPFTSAFYDVSFPSQRKKSNVVCISLPNVGMPWNCGWTTLAQIIMSFGNQMQSKHHLESSFCGTVIQTITSTFMQLDYKKKSVLSYSHPRLGKNMKFK